MRGRLICGLLFFGILLVSFVSAEMLVSNVGVEYDSQISEMFNTSEYVEVFFKLNDPLDADSLLSTLTETEFRLDSDGQRIISGQINMKGFEKLKNDSRIKSIYYNTEVGTNDYSETDKINHTNQETFGIKKESLNFIWIALGIILIILLVLFLILKKKK